MTVQELIDELMKVEDKNLLVYAIDDEMRGDIILKLSTTAELLR